MDDLVDYIYSMTSITGLDEGKRIELTRVLQTRRDDKGILHIPKEYGTFIAKKRD